MFVELLNLKREFDESYKDYANRFFNLCYRFPLKLVTSIFQLFHEVMSSSNELDQSDKNQFFSHNNILIDSIQSSEVINQQYCPTFFTSHNQKEYNVLDNVIVPYDNANSSFLNENKVERLSEESCHSNQDLISI